MAIEAPLSKHKRSTFLIYIAVCIGLALYCVWDGYYNKKFIEKNTVDGVANTTLSLNRKAPPYFVGAGAILGAYLFAIRKRRVVADENALIINDKEKISYDSIQKIDKTNFKSKGFFVITYEKANSGQVDRKISDKTYDNLAPVLDEVIAKIS
jgi:uncharacterized membrane protein